MRKWAVVGLGLWMWLVSVETVGAERTDVAPPMVKRVLVIEFNPKITSQGGKRLTEVKGWANPVNIEPNFVNEPREVSGEVVNYVIVARIVEDEFPIKRRWFSVHRAGLLQLPGRDRRLSLSGYD